MKNLIEQLKDNEKPFGLMSEEMKKEAVDIGIPMFEVWQSDRWQSPSEVVHCYGAIKFLDFDFTYRLRPGYAEKPEIEECEISPPNSDGTKWVRVAEDHTMDFCSCMMHKDFLGFKFEDGTMYPMSTVYKFKGRGMTYYSMDIDRVDEYEVLHATHVLFRKTK